MALRIIDNTHLTNIACAIREKSGVTDPIATPDMATAIANLPSGGTEFETIVLSGDCNKACSGPVVGKLLEQIPDAIATENIWSAQEMFKGYQGSTIPFDLNFDPGVQTYTSGLFMESNITSVPKINNLNQGEYANSWFNGCQYLTEVPDGIADTWTVHPDYNYIRCPQMFYNCHSLRKCSMDLFNAFKDYEAPSPYFSMYHYTFCNCYSLQRIENMPVYGTFSSNTFDQTFNECYSLRHFTFEPGQTANWTNQVIDLANWVSYGSRDIMFTNGGYDQNKQIVDDNTRNLYWQDDDAWTDDIGYAFYTLEQALETIESLPDTSAAGGGNVIKFNKNAGSKMGPMCMIELQYQTDAIAAAAAKGWTVTLVE